jgi:hypothetical protein
VTAEDRFAGEVTREALNAACVVLSEARVSAIADVSVGAIAKLARGGAGASAAESRLAAGILVVRAALVVAVGDADDADDLAKLASRGLRNALRIEQLERELERTRRIESRARRLVDALFEEDAPRLRAIDEMRVELGLDAIGRW